MFFYCYDYILSLLPTARLCLLQLPCVSLSLRVLAHWLARSLSLSLRARSLVCSLSPSLYYYSTATPPPYSSTSLSSLYVWLFLPLLASKALLSLAAVALVDYLASDALAVHAVLSLSAVALATHALAPRALNALMFVRLLASRFLATLAILVIGFSWLSSLHAVRTLHYYLYLYILFPTVSLSLSFTLLYLSLYLYLYRSLYLFISISTPFSIFVSSITMLLPHARASSWFVTLLWPTLVWPWGGVTRPLLHAELFSLLSYTTTFTDCYC